MANNVNKKIIMLLCDTTAAAGSILLLVCSSFNILNVGILCMVSFINGLINAFRTPASQVAVSLLANKRSYTQVGGIQSSLGSVVGILNPNWQLRCLDSKDCRLY